MRNFISSISNIEYQISEKVIGKSIRKSIFDLIKSEYSDFNTESIISISELNQYRQKYIAHYLIKEVGELSSLENDVLKTIESEERLSTKRESDASLNFTFGQRLADKIAVFGGSWKFIIFFGLFILVWIISNIVFLVNEGFDPYPFILLNLILSCLAALQAPVIMMSQNRQEEKDRERAKQDYIVNLKSELEIRMLHEKIDHLIIHQQQELLNIQQVQVEMMEDLMTQISTIHRG
ncbi:putative membrane protein [Winogradskyella epiphytica]|uniref:Putative membrane protein n=1 Tax=Winogradskyella epiphytica TaxID=262005 RepID=A0A2V4WWN7_9FLAO|nr:DUF1003 domain-containing protein [Winogradskyella epiphytica]PYE81646.1 putative membrane protein [Winogradskyella epiphytica]GGW63666.1 hypothetical protein GCM10008085_14480 [Winogradskyella epiphytica]